jgi:hypoxanthine-guanine phosphoribosyltransferase
MVSVSDALIKIVTGLNNKLVSFIDSQSYNTSRALIKDVKIKKEVKSEPMDMELIVLEDRPISESELYMPNQQRKGRPRQLFRGDYAY